MLNNCGSRRGEAEQTHTHTYCEDHRTDCHGISLTHHHSHKMCSIGILYSTPTKRYTTARCSQFSQTYPKSETIVYCITQCGHVMRPTAVEFNCRENFVPVKDVRLPPAVYISLNMFAYDLFNTHEKKTCKLICKLCFPILSLFLRTCHT